MKTAQAKHLHSTIQLPGDKSISHRAAMLAAMAAGETRIENFATSADCSSTLSCLQALGVEIERDGTTVIVKGVGKTGFQKPDEPLDCGNSGTTMRLISGILAGQPFESVLTGDESLSKRPMKRVIEPLLSMGVEVESVDNHAPLKISGRNPLNAFEHELQVASAQIKSCILLAGLNADGQTYVIEKTPTRDHTERMLRWFGVQVQEENVTNGKKLIVSGDAVLNARDIRVPSDVSSAAFFMVAAACLDGSDILIENVGLNPSRTAIIDVLKSLGADIQIINATEHCNEPVGDIRVRGGLTLTEHINRIDGSIIANLIDEIPVLAIFGTQLDGGLEVRDAAELRVKESDRISAVVENLRRMGGEVEEFPDGFRVYKSDLKGTRVDSFGDHRIAMAFAVAGLFAEGETEIDGAECAAVSFPAFFDTLSKAVSYE